MIEIIYPQQYKKCLWKNGKGETIELAINDDGTLDDFDWRLSIAKVNENGDFSNFKGYTRNLVLLEGNGIKLQHNQLIEDNLDSQLSVATFDGGNNTKGILKSGPITDFNLMARYDKYQSSVETYTGLQEITLKHHHMSFIYAVDNELRVLSESKKLETQLPANHLIKIESQNLSEISVYGENIIIAYLNKL
jgi:uncharacterized protein